MIEPPADPHDLGAALRPSMTVDITTRGRSSGLPRRIEIWMFQVDGRHVITGTPGPRDWYANVLTHPELTIHLGPPSHLDLAATALPISDLEFRRRVFTAGHTSWYLTQTPLDELVTSSPMVEVHVTGIAAG